MWGKRSTTTNNNALMSAAQASAASHHNNMDSLHGQLGRLLNDAQALLADIAPGASGSQFGYQQFNGGAVHSGWSGKTSGLQSMLTSQHPPIYSIVAMQAEVRTIEFWRSIICECTATFFYVLIVCSVATITEVANDPVRQTTYCALSAGLAIAIITAAFAGVSGAHANPAVTFAMIFARQISPLRAILYMCAQCGGGVAGAALVNAVYESGIRDPIINESPEKGSFGMEFTLTFMIVYVICASKADTAANQANKPNHQASNFGSTSSYYNSTHGTDWRVPLIGVTSNKPNPIIVGAAYAGCLIAWLGSLNPARALGSAFVHRSDVENRFKQHWIFWVGPFLGAVTGAFAFEYIFNPFRRKGGFSPFTSSNNPSGFGSATATTTTIINTGGGTTGLMTSSSAGALTGNHNTNQMYMGRSEFGNETDRAMTHALDTDIDMLDDMERSKHYKTNIMQDFNDRQSGYGSRSQYNQPYKGTMSARGSDMYDTYGGTSKSMYNQPMGGYDSRDMRSGYYDGTKSMYNGYDGGSDYMRGGMGANDVRRSRSVNQRLPPRRNPYDYLPDEPQTMLPQTGASSGMHAGGPSNVGGVGSTNPILSNKPDIMQSVGMDGTTAGNRAITGKVAMSSPGGRGYGGYGADKIDQRSTYQDHYRDTAGYRDRDMATRGVLKSTNEILGGVGTNPSNMGGAVGGMSANEATDGLAATSGYGTREQQANQRMAHLQSTGRMNRPSGSTDDYGRTGYAGNATGTGSVAGGSTAMGGGGR